MGKKASTLSEQIRHVLEAAGCSRRGVCLVTGIDEGLMSRFMAGKAGLSMESLDAVGAILGLRIVAQGPIRVPPRRKPGRKPKSGKKGR